MSDDPRHLCPKCGGAGLVLTDEDQGRHHRTLRLSVHATQKAIAVGMGISPQYLNDLELGRRAWDWDLACRCEAAIMAIRLAQANTDG